MTETKQGAEGASSTIVKSPLRGIGWLVYLLLFFAVGAAVLGLNSLTQATEGVGMLGAACFLGILARIRQATDYQMELRSLFDVPLD